MNFVGDSKTLSLLELYFPMCEDDFIAADTTICCIITHTSAILGFKVVQYSV